MRTITAMCLAWSAFIVGCAGAVSVDDSVGGPGDQPPGNDQGEITPSTLQVPRLRAPGEDFQFPPLESVPDDRSAITIAVPTETVPGDTDPGGTDPGGTDPGGTDPGGTIDGPIDVPIAIETPIDVPIIPIPRLIEGNPECEDAYPGSGAVGFKLEGKMLKDGTYSDGAITVTVDFDGSTVDYTTTSVLLGVIVKGGAHAIAYPPEADGTGVDLATPAGEAVSHVTFCYVP